MTYSALHKGRGTMLKCGRTIENFLCTLPTTDISVSPGAVYAQVACLLERVHDLSETYISGTDT